MDSHTGVPTTAQQPLSVSPPIRRPEIVTLIGWLAITLALIFLGWMVSNGVVNPKTLPPQPSGRVVAYAVLALLLWSLFIKPGLDLLALREAGRRRMILISRVLTGWVWTMAWLLLCALVIMMATGLYDVVAHANIGPSSFPPRSWPPWLNHWLGALTIFLAVASWFLARRSLIAKLQSAEVTEAFAAAQTARQERGA